MTSVFPLDRNI